LEEFQSMKHFQARVGVSEQALELIKIRGRLRGQTHLRFILSKDKAPTPPGPAIKLFIATKQEELALKQDVERTALQISDDEHPEYGGYQMAALTVGGVSTSLTAEAPHI